jgi:hypothetical protein
MPFLKAKVVADCQAASTEVADELAMAVDAAKEEGSFASTATRNRSSGYSCLSILRILLFFFFFLPTFIVLVPAL